jgi:hypothetical protein
VRVLLVVGSAAVAVLEVDAQVLDRLGLQLGHDRAPDLADLLDVQAAGPGQVVGPRSVPGQRRGRLGAPGGGQVRTALRDVAVGGDVDGVHRLPVRPVTGVGRHALCV